MSNINTRNGSPFPIFFSALVWLVFIAFTINAASSAMLIPSLLAAVISGIMNFSIFWNRMGVREQKKALVAIGWADDKI